MRRAVIHSRVEHCVRFLGFVPIETLRVVFHALATAFVFPSLYEGFGLPPLEAMASGTPVIASEVSSLPEVVGGAAMLVNPENVFDIARGITEVLLNDELKKELIVKGRLQAARFSWAETATQVLQLYEDIRGRRYRAVEFRASRGDGRIGMIPLSRLPSLSDYRSHSVPEHARRPVLGGADCREDARTGFSGPVRPVPIPGI